ncbi:MAG: prephenate dehydrogenase, partial [Acidobacteriota bacterium]|nr:prephenate dehydrogenase [Acidobacteriota bacterium]
MNEVVMNEVAIVGVGLIGGSFALALRGASFTGQITGVSSPGAISDALERRIIDRALPLEEAAARADLIYLAQPIGRILHTLQHLDQYCRPGTLMTDAGSTKQAIVTAARRFITRAQFLGGHPLAGKELRGAAAADAELFRGRPYVLSPADPTDLETPIASEFLQYLRRMGARIVVLGAAEHDRLVAASSHVPQL